MATKSLDDLYQEYARNSAERGDADFQVEQLQELIDKLAGNQRRLQAQIRNLNEAKQAEEFKARAEAGAQASAPAAQAAQDANEVPNEQQ